MRALVPLGVLVALALLVPLLTLAPADAAPALSWDFSFRYVEGEDGAPLFVGVPPPYVLACPGGWAVSWSTTRTADAPRSLTVHGAVEGLLVIEGHDGEVLDRASLWCASPEVIESPRVLAHEGSDALGGGAGWRTAPERADADGTLAAAPDCLQVAHDAAPSSHLAQGRVPFSGALETLTTDAEGRERGFSSGTWLAGTGPWALGLGAWPAAPAPVDALGQPRAAGPSWCGIAPGPLASTTAAVGLLGETDIAWGSWRAVHLG